MAMADELAKSPYLCLFKDENFKRWYQNVKKRRSANTAYEWFLRMGTIHRRFNVLPKDFLKLGEKKRVQFLMDMVHSLKPKERADNTSPTTSSR
jgi:hypothetical protein